MIARKNNALNQIRNINKKKLKFTIVIQVKYFENLFFNQFITFSFFS